MRRAESVLNAGRWGLATFVLKIRLYSQTPKTFPAGGSAAGEALSVRRAPSKTSFSRDFVKEKVKRIKRLVPGDNGTR